MYANERPPRAAVCRSFANRHAVPRENNKFTRKGDSPESGKNWDRGRIVRGEHRERKGENSPFSLEFNTDYFVERRDLFFS